MSATQSFNEQLLQRLPLPLAQLCRRSQNAKSPLEQHLAAYYLWEASLKLLGATAVVEYAALKDRDPEITEKLKNLARPAVGHWWEFVRRLVPVLADKGDKGFGNVRDLVLGRARDDMPRAAGLFAGLGEALDGKAGARTTVRLTELFDRLVTYRNREIGHGAAGQRPIDFYRRMAGTLSMGLAQILDKLDVIAGRRIVYIGDVRRLADGGWLIERYLLVNETPRRLEPLLLTEKETPFLPRPECVCLEGRRDIRIASPVPILRSLHPLVHYEPDACKLFFLNARRGKQQVEYLCYSTGETLIRDIGTDQRELLGQILNQPIDASAVAVFAARSLAEEKADDVPARLPIGRAIGEYELLSRLGQGGMGVVYRAWQPSLGRQVALKCMLRVNDPKGEARFAREIRALGRIEHPNVVKVFTSGADGDQWFYAMELIEGAELSRVCEHLTGSSAADIDAARWQNALTAACAQVRTQETQLGKSKSDSAQKLPVATFAPVVPASTPNDVPLAGKDHVRQVVDIVRQVSDAVHALHEAGVVHRDIKPGNIMLTADGSHPVLMDLGLAQLADETDGKLTRTRQFVGTLRYASPEQILAVGQVDRRTDVYSLGITLWELLTLRPAFGADDNTPTPDLMLTIQSTDLENPRKYNRNIPRDLSAIVMKCVEKDRTRRYATASDLADDLNRWLQGKPVNAQPPQLLYVASKFARRHRIGIATVSAILLGGLLTAAIAFYKINDALVVAEAALEQKEAARDEAEKHAKAAEESAAEADRKGKETEEERQRSNDLANILGMRLLRKNQRTQKLEDPESAINDLMKSAEFAEAQLRKKPSDEIKFELADIYDSLRNLHLQRQDVDREKATAGAAATLEKCIQLQNELSTNHPLLMLDLAWNYLDLGGYYSSLRKRAKVLESDLKALEILQKLPGKGFDNATTQAAMSRAHLVLGLDYQNIGDQANSLKHFNDSARILEQLSDGAKKGTQSFHSYQALLGTSYQQLGIAYMLHPKGITEADAEEALKRFEKADKFYAGKSQHRMSLAEVNRWRSSALLKLNKPDEAVDYAKKGTELADAVYKDLPQKSPQIDPVIALQVRLLGAQAKAYQKKKEYKAAEDLFHESLVACEKMSRKLANAPSAVEAFQDLAVCFAEQKRYKPALDSIAQAIDIQVQYVKGEPGDYVAHTTAGNLYFSEGLYHYNEMQYKLALESHQKAKAHEIRAFELRGGKDFGANLYTTYEQEFFCQIKLKDYSGAVASVKDRIALKQTDREKHLDAAKDLNNVYQRDLNQLPAIASVFETALAKDLFDMQKLTNDRQFDRLLSERIIRELITKYQGK